MLSLNFVPHVDTLVVFSIFGQAIRPRPYSFHSRYMCTVDMILSMLRPTQQNLVELLDDCSLDDELRNSSSDYEVLMAVIENTSSSHHQTKNRKENNRGSVTERIQNCFPNTLFPFFKCVSDIFILNVFSNFVFPNLCSSFEFPKLFSIFNVSQSNV